MPFGLLYPLSLLLVPLGVAALVWAYRKHGQGKRTVVSSTFLFEALREKASFRKKFRPPLRFFLELLLLFALIAGAAGLYRNDSGEHVALVLDNSLSMSAEYFREGMVRSRFDRAKVQARTLIDSLASTTQLSLFVVSPELEQVGESEMSLGEAKERLDELSVGYLADNLAGALSRFAYQPQYSRIYVVSDKKPVWPDEDASSSSFSFRTLDDTSATQDNIALSQVRISSGDNKEGNLTASLTLYGNEAKQGTLEVKRYVNTGSSWQTSLARSASFSLEPGETKEMTFKELSLESPYRLELTSLARSGGAWSDPLARDNVAWISHRKAEESITVVGKRSPAELGLLKLSHVQWQHLSQQQYEEQGLTEEGSSAAIFDRYIPAELPKTNALFLLPEGSSGPLVSKVFVPDAELSAWNTTHPLLSYVNFSALSMNGAYVLEGPTWMEEELSVEEGPIVLAGEQGGYRYLGFGFDLFPFTGKRAPALSVLALNAFGWLAPTSHHSLYVQAGTTLSSLDSTSTVTGLDRAEGEPTESSRLLVPDLYLVKEPGKSPDFVAVNFFDGSESNLLESGSVLIPPRTVSFEPSSPQLLSERLAHVALVLLLLDFFFFVLLPLFRSKQRRELRSGEIGGVA